MKDDFNVGDHVEWNSEAGRVSGTIIKKVTSEIPFKGYTVHASEDEPQYLIKRGDHIFDAAGESPTAFATIEGMIKRKPFLSRRC